MKSRKIAFCIPKYTLRGADVVLWGYAYFADGYLLPHESWILVYDDVPKDYVPMIHEPENRDIAMGLFEPFREKGRLRVCSRETLEPTMNDLGIDLCYFYVAGFENERPLFPKSIPSIAQCIFNGRVPLGSVHCVVSQFVPHLPTTRFLPNMVLVSQHEKDLRVELGIPEDAVVFGRYGGKHTFSIHWVQSVVVEMAKCYSNCYFIFMNTEPFLNTTELTSLPNICFLKGTADFHKKGAFINTCDAMLHARIDGETFGCAIGEFAVKGKPIFTSPCFHESFGYSANAHLAFLKGHETYVYHSPTELRTMMESFRIKKMSGEKTTNHTYKGGMYNEFHPQQVMLFFQKCVEEAMQGSVEGSVEGSSFSPSSPPPPPM